MADIRNVFIGVQRHNEPRKSGNIVPYRITNPPGNWPLKIGMGMGMGMGIGMGMGMGMGMEMAMSLSIVV